MPGSYCLRRRRGCRASRCSTHAIVAASRRYRRPTERQSSCASRWRGRRACLRADFRSAPLPAARATALAALEAAAPSANSLSTGVSAYGELEPDIFASHRLTILQLGDSHTAADFFTRPGARAPATGVRDRRRRLYRAGQAASRRALGAVRRATPPMAGPTRRCRSRTPIADFYLSGFNAIAHRRRRRLDLRSRGGAPMTGSRSRFSSSPAAGRAEVLIDGTPTGDRSISTARRTSGRRSALRAPATGAPVGFREIAVRALTDAPVTVTGVDVGREGDGVSYLSSGLPRRHRAVAAAARRPRISPTTCAGWRPISSCSPSAPTKASTTTSISPPIPRNTSRSSVD